MKAIVLFCLFGLSSALRLMPLSTIIRSSMTSLRGTTMENTMDGIVIDGELEPVWNNMLIKVKEIADVSAGGLFIPDNAKQRPTEGVVIRAGKGRIHPDTAKLIPNAVAVGESVMYGKFDGTEIKYNDQNYQVIKDDDVLLKYTGSEATLENVEPVKDQVMVRLPPKEEANASGIIISTPGSAEKRPDWGTVVKVGPGRPAGNGEIMKMQVEPGMNVRFREYAGTDVKIDGVDYRVLRAYDILGTW